MTPAQFVAAFVFTALVLWTLAHIVDKRRKSH